MRIVRRGRIGERYSEGRARGPSDRAPEHLDVHPHIISEPQRRKSQARTSALQDDAVARSDELRVAGIERVHRDLVRRPSREGSSGSGAFLYGCAGASSLSSRASAASMSARRTLPKTPLSDANVIQPRWRRSARGSSRPEKPAVVSSFEAHAAEIEHQVGVLDDPPRLLRGHSRPRTDRRTADGSRR